MPDAMVTSQTDLILKTTNAQRLLRGAQVPDAAGFRLVVRLRTIAA
jgi:hypothetical protein